MRYFGHGRGSEPSRGAKDNLRGRRAPSPGFAGLVILASGLLLASCRREPAPSDGQASATLPSIEFSLSAESVDCYETLEVSIRVDNPTAKNPFTDVFVSGWFKRVEGQDGLRVNGFCDSPDGRVYRIRFMPSNPGLYAFSVEFWQNDLNKIYRGTFEAKNSGRRGPIRADPKYPWHFVWEGTGEHYYLNGTTAFLLMGWTDERIIRECLDRFNSLLVNRIRVLLDGRTDHFWTEPVKPNGLFCAYLNPWVAERPDDVRNPGFDYSRFNCAYWQKFERMLKHARDKDMIISVIFGWNDTAVHPLAGSEDERRYFDYAVSRLGGYSNVTWDLGDDLDWFRSETWTHSTGTLVHDIDPYRHLATSHPASDNRHQDRASEWFGMTSFQRWERPLHDWMLDQRRQQAETGRIIPQVNEEYGYEDHYPRWAPYRAPAASAEFNRRAAWEMAMAGCYQTTGETAKRGTGIRPDTGGGWINGRGDDTMVMLRGYAQLVKFFTGFEWWKLDPHDELVTHGAFCLADIGNRYVAYLPHGGEVAIKLSPHRYEAMWFNPRSGEYSPAFYAEGSEWKSPGAPDQNDWILTLKRGE